MNIKNTVYEKPSHFPLLVKYDNGEEMIIEHPSDIINGKGFKVLKTNYILQDNKNV